MTSFALLASTREWMDSLPALRMSPREFHDLPEYSSTLPTGTIPGKRWRRLDGIYDRTCDRPRWVIGEYGAIQLDGRHIAIIWHRPIICVRG